MITWPPNPDATYEKTPSVRRAQFEGGALHIAKGDIRTPKTWSVSWSLTRAETLNFLADLANAGVNPIMWQAPTDDSPRAYVLTQLRTVALAGKVFRVECELKEWLG